MPRPPRIQVPGGIYHVTNKGCAERAIFLDDGDRRCFESILAKTILRHGWCLSIYCLMTTHYHLLVTTPLPDLAAGIQWLNGLYGQTFNRRHSARGHLFMRRYSSEFVQTERHFMDAARYIALNPVEAGICRRPEDWPWSSYAAILGRRSPQPFVDPTSLLESFATDPDLARARFQSFVEDRSQNGAPLNRV
jgi:REP-associated tyrosine transposase